MAEKKQNINVVIVAAGKGSRFGGDLPKQFSMLGDRPVLMHTVIRIARALPTANIVMVLQKDYMQYWERMCELYGFVSPKVVMGGETRWESVKNAVESLPLDPDSVVMIHDGVRPMVTTEMMQRILSAIKDNDAVIPYVQLTDSLRCIDGDTSHAVDRSQLVAVQTPQALPRRKAHRGLQQALSERSSPTTPLCLRLPDSDLRLWWRDRRSTSKSLVRADIDIAALYMGIR